MSFVSELRRRNVFRVAAAYVVTAWLAIQVVETILPAFGYGDTAVRYVTIAFAVGLVPVLVLSWVFEWTPEGFKRDAEVGGSALTPGTAARRLDRSILVVLALALGYFAFDKFLLEPQRKAEAVARQQANLEQARQEGRTEALVESYGDKSIAVLPFRDLSPEGDQEYFSEGIAEELLNLLARESQLRVISRTSAFAFKDQGLAIPEIAKRLKVGYVLEGSVRKAGSKVRITAQLIEARSDTHLWSQTWDRELANILAIQDEIAGAVAESLQGVLLGPAGSATAPSLTDAEVEAYELVLKGRHLLNQATQDAYQRALPLYERAIEAAPDYAPAHAGLAKVLRQMRAGSGGLDSMDADLRIEQALDRALELDPDDPDALATRGAVLGLRAVRPDIEAAREYWRRAIAVNPNDGDALRWLGLSYDSVDSVRYLEYMERAYSVAPTNALVSMWVAWALARFDRFDEALVILGDWHALDPDDTRPFTLAGDLFFQRRQLDLALKSYYQAFRMAPQRADQEINGIGWLIIDGLSMPSSPLLLKWVERIISVNPGSVEGHMQKIVATWASGRRAEASRLIDEFSQRNPDSWALPARMHLIFTRDYRRSREWWEAGTLADPGLHTLNAEYAFVLQQTGDGDRARAILDATLAAVEEQLAAGVKSVNLWELNFAAGFVHAIQGNNLQALDYLRRDAANGGLSSVGALKRWPEFDGLRDDPAFQALIAEQDEKNADWKQRLETEGLLLAPEEVLAPEDFAFNPFERAEQMPK